MLLSAHNSYPGGKNLSTTNLKAGTLEAQYYDFQRPNKSRARALSKRICLARTYHQGCVLEDDKGSDLMSFRNRPRQNESSGNGPRNRDEYLLTK